MLESLSVIIRKAGINIFKEDKTIENIGSKEKALKIVKDFYKGFDVTVHQMPGGLAYYIEFKNNKYQIANYDFQKERLTYRLPKEYVFKKLAQYYDIDPDMLLKLLQDYLDDVQKDWNYVLPTELNELIETGNNKYFLVDVRRPDNYAEGHIPGAINIFWLDILKKENLNKLPIDKTILVYCYVGHTSSQVMTLLNLLGYKAKSLKFGMGISPDESVKIKGWKDYNFPVVKGPNPK